MTPLLLFVLLSLTAYRATRLLVRDQFPPIEVQRVRMAARWGEESWQAYLARCPWCAGVYVSAAVTAAAWWALDGMPAPVLMWGGSCAVVGLLSAIDLALSGD